MKTLVFMFAFILFQNNLHSFTNKYNYFLEWELNELSQPDISMKSGGVKKISLSKITKRASKLIQTKEFNREGYLIGGEYFDNKGNIVSYFENTFNDQNQLIEVKLTLKKSTKFTSYSYHSSGKISSIEIKENGNFLQGMYKSYNEENQIIETIFKNKKGVTWRTLFTYDEAGKLSLSESFNNKGKLVRRFNYSCRQEGEVLDLKKNENTICQFDALETGFLIRISESMDSKGRVTRTIHKYQASDTSLVERKFENYQGKTTIRFRYKDQKEIERISYDNKGSEKVKTIYQYDINGNKLLSQIWIKGKKSYEEKLIYDEHGIWIKKKLSGKSDKKTLFFSRKILETYN